MARAGPVEQGEYPFRVYSVTPDYDLGNDAAGADFAQRLAAGAKGCEAAGVHGILVPHNLHDVDPWMAAAYIGSVTDRLIPLIAVQPATMPPQTAAAIAAAFAALFGRPLYFNLVAGARDDEMRRIGDVLSHDERYERLAEYSRVVRALTRGDEVDTIGRYAFNRYRLEPRPALTSECKLFMAGSSAASLKTAVESCDVVVTHPTPVDDWRESHLSALRAEGVDTEIGIRIGIVTRPSRHEALAFATEKFPQSWRSRQETLLKTRSANEWSRRLAELAVAEAELEEAEGLDALGTYWLGAFRSGRASAPYLIGSYEEVAAALCEYLALGVRHVLLSDAIDDDYAHTTRALRLAASSA